MSVKYLTKAFESEYQPTTKIILLALADYASDDGSCFPSWENLMNKTSIKSRNTIAKHLKILEDDGVLTRKQRFSNSNYYYLYPNSTNNVLLKVEGTPNDTSRVSNGGTPRVSNGETLTVNEPSINHKRFTPPTKDELLAYKKEKNLAVDVDYFYDYFTEGNWIDMKGNKVKNWKQKMLTWSKQARLTEKPKVKFGGL